jgi:capsular polysaccharide biosynthesis protein
VNDPDQTVTFPAIAADDQPEPWPYDDFATAEDRPVSDFAAGLTSLPYIRAALRRSVRLWCAIAAIGMLLGFGLYTALPPAYAASAKVYVLNDPTEDPISAMLTDETVAQSRAVAAIAMRKLGLRESIGSFIAATTVAVAADRVLLVNVSAPSTSDAVLRANALAAAFLQFRKQQLASQLKLVVASLELKITEAKQQIKSIDSQISKLSAAPTSPAQQAKLSGLEATRTAQSSALTVLANVTRGTEANAQNVMATMVSGSIVLDRAAPVTHSRKKLALIYIATGLIAGLVIGMGLVIVRALVSDRLRRRDDVADALGAPVKLSVGTVRVSRWLPGRRGLAAAQARDVQRIVVHLRHAVPETDRGAATLAVIALDNPHVAALSVASLAVSCAQRGQQVILADLCGGAPAARLLGNGSPGFRALRVDGARLLVAVPDKNDVAPAGPLRRNSPSPSPSPSQPSGQPSLAAADPASEPTAPPELAAAFSEADLLLTLVSLEPSFGGEHLSAWATDAVAVIVAGQSSSTKIHAVGEMTRLAGTRLVSAVLVGADKADESLGITSPPSPSPSPPSPPAPPAPPGPGLGVIG